MSILGPWEITTQLGASLSPEIVRVEQVHGGDIVWAPEVGTATISADGIAALSTFKQPFMISTADCLPLVVVSDTAACALHVSRKTLLHGLLDRVPDIIDPNSIVGVWIGPHVCAHHFVFEWMGKDIVAFINRFPEASEEREGGVHLSTRKATISYLEKWGVSAELIQMDGRCTYEETSLPSYRRTLRDKEKLTFGLATIVRSL